MQAHDLNRWLDRHFAPWPSDRSPDRSAGMGKKFADLPDEISGISLKVLKDTALPPWKDGDRSELIALLHPDGAVVGKEQLLQEILALPAPALDELDDRMANALMVAARAHRKQGTAERAVELLWSAARLVLLRPEGAFFALWLLEIAERWLDKVNSDRWRGLVEADLGILVAQVIDQEEGAQLTRKGSDRLFALAGRTNDPAITREAWQTRYEAVKGNLRNRSVGEAETAAELSGIQQMAPADSEVWFHAAFEQIAAEASQQKLAGNMVKAEQLGRTSRLGGPAGPRPATPARASSTRCPGAQPGTGQELVPARQGPG